MAASKPTQARCFLVMGAYTWGRGKTEDEAVRNYLKEGGPVKLAILYDAPASFNINEVTGGIMYNRESPPPRELKRGAIKAGRIK